MDTNAATHTDVDMTQLGNIAALVVDDDRESANLVRAILEPLGVSVVSVGTAEEADLMLAAITPEVVLCDLSLPGEDGLAFMRRLRGRPAQAIRNIPAIALTAAYERFDARTAREAGFDVFLKKPPDPEQLPHIVALLAAGGRRPSSRPSAERRHA